MALKMMQRDRGVQMTLTLHKDSEDTSVSFVTQEMLSVLE
jgi:hypothetical protein